jgi:hypothetical protein
VSPIDVLIWPALYCRSRKKLRLKAQKGVDVQADASSFNSLPQHLQCIILAASGAPLNTCKAASLIAQDSDLTGQWLLATCNKPLLTAAKHGLWDACQRLLDAGECRTTADIYLAAYYAATAGETVTLARLLEGGNPAGGNQWDDVLRKAYLEAAISGQAGSCKLLQQHHPALLPSKCEEGGALSTAVQNGHANVVSTMLDACKASLQPAAYQSLEQDVFKAACRHNQVAVATSLLSRGADVNSGNTAFDWERSLLGLALRSSAWEVARVLLKCGAHVEGVTETGSALACAAHKLWDPAGLMACTLLLGNDLVRVGGGELVAAVKSLNVELLTWVLRCKAKQDALAKQDEQHRAECLGKALAEAVDTREPDMVAALLAPPPHRRPVTALVLQPALNKAAYWLEQGKDVVFTTLCLLPVSTCCLPAPCRDVLSQCASNNSSH